jgi:hypothetical protein
VISPAFTKFGVKNSGVTSSKIVLEDLPVYILFLFPCNLLINKSININCIRIFPMVGPSILVLPKHAYVIPSPVFRLLVCQLFLGSMTCIEAHCHINRTHSIVSADPVQTAATQFHGTGLG